METRIPGKHKFLGAAAEVQKDHGGNTFITDIHCDDGCLGVPVAREDLSIGGWDIPDPSPL
jgi:hypothetical protein